MTECIYCGTTISRRDNIVPEIDDDCEWERLAELHWPTCEWILTRAHRLQETNND